MFTIFRYLLLACLLSAGFASSAFSADEKVDVGDAVVAFFNDPIPTQRNTLTLSEADHLGFLLMDDVTESVVNSDPDRLIKAVSRAREQKTLMSDQSLRVLAFSETVMGTIAQEAELNRFVSLLSVLQNFDAQDDWYVRSTTHSLAAFILITKNETVQAAREVDSAMTIIPTELSDWATGARLLASEVALALHGIQGNPEFMLEAAVLQREAKSAIGEDFNRYELMTNFIYAFNRSRNFQAAAKTAELLLVEPRPSEMIAGLSNVYIAQTYNELRRYQEAKDLAQEALMTSDHPHILRRADNAYMISLAGLGQVEEARAFMQEKGLAYSHDELLNEIDAEAILHAEALIASHIGDAPLAIALIQRRTDLIISRVQKSNSSRMTSMLSNLENTRGRQLERESALEREAELRAKQLEQQTKTNRLLWVLLAVLTIAFNLLLAFLRYREKNNRKVQALQEEALSAEKMKTEFLGVVNHELRTPLNGIIGISDAMIHHASDPILKTQAEAVQESGQLLFDLLDSLITMSTIEGDRLTLASEEVDLSRIITSEAQEWEAAAQAKAVAFSHYVSPDVGTLLISDKKHFRQCVRYLLSNAVRFTHEGRIHLHATAEPDGPKHMQLCLIVADTGQGISDAVLERLFKPFLQADSTMTRKYGGAGLSLAIARKLARMMDGDLTVTTREGRGSEFKLTARLPRADVYNEGLDQSHFESATDEAIAPTVTGDAIRIAAPADPLDTEVAVPVGIDQLEEPEDIIDLMLNQQLFSDGEDAEARPAPLSSLSVLVGDDMTLQTSGLRAGLKSIGCRAVPCDDADTLIEQLGRQRFDVVILNLRAPALGGIDTIERIRTLSGPAATIPILALDQAGKTYGRDGDDPDFTLCLTHPVTEEELTVALRTLDQAKRAA